MLKTFPKAHLAAAFVISTVVGATLIFSASTDVEAKRMSVSLDLDTVNSQPDNTVNTGTSVQPALAKSSPVSDPGARAQDPAPVAGRAPVAQPAPTLHWSSYGIESGDNLSGLFKRAGFDDGLMLSVIHGSGDASNLERLYAGETIAFATDSKEQLKAIKLQRSQLQSLRIDRKDDGFVGKKVIREPEIRTTYAEATISNSLFGAGQEAGLTDKLTMELAGIFGWDIDFALDIRKGDRFSLVYEELYLDGEKIDNGKILAATFFNQNQNYSAVLYTDKHGNSDYYTPEGRSMRKAFLRTPVDFARISSSFNLHRKHPVLNTIRAHKGTDYAASTGTPIKAAGEGRIIYAGRKGGYGNAIVIQHGYNITTLYGHMNGFARGIRSGKHVKQGQTIGYVGQTGLATGPHLHYEFRVNGAPRNPVTVKLPDAAPIPKSELARFKTRTQLTLAQLETYQNSGPLTLAKGE